MAGFENDVCVCDNLNFDPSTPRPHLGIITQDGELLIGSATAPFIRAGLLASSNNTILTTLGPGTIDLSVGPSVNRFIQSDSGLIVSSSNKVNILGSGGITTSAAGSTLTIDGSAIGAGTITGDSGGALSQTAGNWNILGSSNIDTSGSGSTLTIDLSATPSVTSITISNAPVSSTDGANKAYVDLIAAGFEFKSTCYAATTGALTANYLNGVAGVGATLTNAGALVAFAIDGTSPPITSRILVKDQGSTFQNGIYTLTTVGSGAIAWVLTRATDFDQVSEIQSGDLVPVANGTVNTDTIWLQTATVATIGTDPILFTKFSSAPYTTTQNAVLIGAANNGIASTAVGSTGQVLQGNTAAAPTYSTATFPSASGGSGKILYDNGTNFVLSTPTFPASASASTGKIIISDGTNWVGSTPTYPNAASTALKHIKSDGTNFVTTTVTYPDASVTAGKVIVSDGTNYIASTPTFPNTSSTAGKIIIADGTNWIASTPTYPNTSGTAGKVVISDGTNNVYSTPTFPNASATTRKIIVSDGTNWVASTETYAVPGTSGNVLTSDGTNWTSAAPAAGGMTWTEVTGTSQSAAVNKGYIANNAGLVTVTLPGTFAVGDIIAVVGKGAGLWVLDAPAGDTIHFGNQDTTSGGTITATNRYDTIEVIGITADAEWCVTGRSQGNLTVA